MRMTSPLVGLPPVASGKPAEARGGKNGRHAPCWRRRGLASLSLLDAARRAVDDASWAALRGFMTFGGEAFYDELRPAYSSQFLRVPCPPAAFAPV